MRKSIFTAELQFSWNWVLMAQIGAQAFPELRSWENQFLTADLQFSWNWVLTAPYRRTSCPRAQIMRKSIFSSESQFSLNWVLTAQIGAQAVPELRSWENQFLRPNRNFHEIGCSRRKSAHKRPPSSDHGKMNFYRRIAIFIKLGADIENRRMGGPRGQIISKRIFTSESQFSWNWVAMAQIGERASPISDYGKMNFYGRIAIFMKLGVHSPNRRKSGPRAQIMEKWIFTAESQFSWNCLLTAQIGAQAAPELRSWQNEFLRPNCNFH